MNLTTHFYFGGPIKFTDMGAQTYRVPKIAADVPDPRFHVPPDARTLVYGGSAGDHWGLRRPGVYCDFSHLPIDPPRFLSEPSWSGENPPGTTGVCGSLGSTATSLICSRVDCDYSAAISPLRFLLLGLILRLRYRFAQRKSTKLPYLQGSPTPRSQEYMSQLSWSREVHAERIYHS